MNGIPYNKIVQVKTCLVYETKTSSKAQEFCDKLNHIFKDIITEYRLEDTFFYTTNARVYLDVFPLNEIEEIFLKFVKENLPDEEDSWAIIPIEDFQDYSEIVECDTNFI